MHVSNMSYWFIAFYVDMNIFMCSLVLSESALALKSQFGAKCGSAEGSEAGPFRNIPETAFCLHKNWTWIDLVKTNDNPVCVVNSKLPLSENKLSLAWIWNLGETASLAQSKLNKICLPPPQVVSHLFSMYKNQSIKMSIISKSPLAQWLLPMNESGT